MKILVVLPVDESHKKRFLEICPDAEFTFTAIKDVTKEMAQDADIIIGNVAPDLIKGSEKLKWIQLNSAGTDGYTAEGVLNKNALLTNATGAYGLAISEHMIAGLLTLMKKIYLYQDNMKDHNWHDEGSVTSIWNSKSLIVGYGNIGSEFATRMNALGSKVTAIRRNKSEKPDYLEALYTMDALDDCLKEADIVASALPGTAATYHVFNEKTFAEMKEGSFFINIGRGTAVDSYALADALNSGHLAGAIIDVTEPEPLPKDHPLWDAKNLIITPHVSGGYHLHETFERIVRISQNNLEKFIKGEELQNIVDFETGYRRFTDK